jgi:pyridoxine 5-phosphate synthase
VIRLSDLVHIKLNLEMAATPEMVDIACGIAPQMAMLVPEGRAEITTEGGLNVLSDRPRLTEVIKRLEGAGVTTSVFIDAQEDQIQAAAEIGARVCEVHTGPYAAAFHERGRGAESPAVSSELEKVARAGALIHSLGMGFNAGHALNYANVGPVAALKGLSELHIGHSIVSRALFLGIREAVSEMKQIILRSQPD